MNPYLFSIIIGGLTGGILGYLITVVRAAPLFGIVGGVICGVLAGPGLLADIRRWDKNRLQKKYERGQVDAAKK